jgi:peptidoglycan/xylan/chitin deacetylase (PgdA/CDA1 family)
MQYLQDNQFTVWPLSRTLTYLTSGKALPPKTLVLTFDDAYDSVYRAALPVLKEKGWPFTVFVTSRYVDEGYSNYMSWQQLRKIQEFGGEIANHSRTHAHLVRRQSGETEGQWRLRITNEITQAQVALQQHVGSPIRVFAYPYGEYSTDVKSILRELGYFALGQQSGAVSRTTDFQAIPRFPMATDYDDMEEFALKAMTKDLPVTVLSPDDGVLGKGDHIPELMLQLKAGNYKKAELTCYASGQGGIQLEWLDQEKDIVKVRANESLKPGRTKYNCTAPSKTESNVYYWFSFLWMQLEADGSWYRE